MKHYIVLHLYLSIVNTEFLLGVFVLFFLATDMWCHFDILLLHHLQSLSIGTAARDRLIVISPTVNLRRKLPTAIDLNESLQVRRASALMETQSERGEKQFW